MQRKERGAHCACNCTARCIEDGAVRACAARPMHVVSTSMSRRDLNFPTLGAPYRIPVPPPSRSRSRAATTPLLHAYSMQLSSPSAPQTPRPALARSLHLPARERMPVVITNTHVRVPPTAKCTVCVRFYARATTHDFSPTCSIPGLFASSNARVCVLPFLKACLEDP